MAFCENRKCNAVYLGPSWLGRYCSRACAYQDNRADWEDCAPLYDPADPTGERVIARNRDEVDAMLELATIDKRLPRIVYLRAQKKTLREIGRDLGVSEKTIRNILAKSAPNPLM
jgi:DNA-directed RNA polymerase specialized sigma subunit